MAEFVELGATAFDHVVEKHGEIIYDKIQRVNPMSSQYKNKNSTSQSASQDNNNEDTQSNSRSIRSSNPHHHHRHQAELPSPERERDDYYYNNDRDFERQSQTSERVIRDYENERDDPLRRPKASQQRYYDNRTRMSNGYDDRRASSQNPPPRYKYDDEDSDYDEHTGRRQRRSGKGYDDRDYDREVIETEVYRGPPRNWGDQRSGSYQENGDYAVGPYRGNGDVGGYDSKRRSRSRGRREKERGDYDERGYGRDERGERDEREHDGFREKLEETFDKSPQGLGAGLAGAIVGGLAGRQFGNKRHTQRDMVIGAIVGGLAVNAAEQKFRNWKEDRDEERYEDDRRSRSAMR